MDRVRGCDRARRAAGRVGMLVVLAGIAAGCGREDADGLARIGRKSLARTKPLTAEAGDRLAAGWQALRGGDKDTPVEARVLSRLRWDKELAGAEIAVQSVQGGVELKGKVRSAEQKQRAAELAQATTGVETVKDALEVTEPEP